MSGVNALKAFENLVNVVVDALTIIGVWKMNPHPPMKRPNNYLGQIRFYFQDPRRALLMFISWNVTSSPGSVGTDMIYNYFTADTIAKMSVNAVLRIGIEGVKFYILYQFCLFYRKLVKEDKPVMIEWTTDQGSLSPTLVLTPQSTGGTDKPAAPAAAIFKRRASFVEGRVGGGLRASPCHSPGQTSLLGPPQGEQHLVTLSAVNTPGSGIGEEPASGKSPVGSPHGHPAGHKRSGNRRFSVIVPPHAFPGSTGRHSPARSQRSVGSRVDDDAAASSPGDKMPSGRTARRHSVSPVPETSEENSPADQTDNL